MASPIIRQCHHAEAVLKRLMDSVPAYTGDVYPDEERLRAQRESVIQIQHARMACWMAFGEVLGYFLDEDTEFRLGDAKAVESRSFKLQPADTPDRVLRRLTKSEATFDHSSASFFTPEEAISFLQPSVEGLAKRIWPRDFKPPHFKANGGFWGLLQDKLRHGSSLEKRFASIAMSLHSRYRNPADHDIDEFESSFEEARYYFAGLRALVTLWQRLCP